MTLKFYSLFSLLFVVLLGNFVYFFVSKESASLEFFGTQYSAYPIAILIVLPIILFYAINVVLMSVSSLQSYLKLRKYERDFENLKDAFYNAYLFKEKKFDYKTDRYRLLGDLVESTIMQPKPNAIIEDNAKIQSVFSEIEKLELDEVADFKRFSLSKDNPLMIRNAKNRLRTDDESAEKVLANASHYDDATVKEAFATYAHTASLSDLLKYKQYISIRSLLQIISRVNSDEHALELSLEDILEFARNVTQAINSLGYIELAMSVRTALIPEERMKLFDTLSDEEFEVSEALLYTLLDLEMIDMARELLDNYEEKDFPKYRAFIALKDSGYSCNIDLIVT